MESTPDGQTSDVTTDSTGTSVVVAQGPKYTDDQLLDITEFGDAFKLVESTLGAAPIDASQVLGNGFAIVSDKDSLIGVPLVILGWNFNEGDFGEFVSATIVAQPKGGGVMKVILNDGSAGVYRQLRDYTEKTGKMGGLLIRGGLTRSDYKYVDQATGKETPARTYYLDTSM